MKKDYLAHSLTKLTVKLLRLNFINDVPSSHNSNYAEFCHVANLVFANDDTVRKYLQVPYDRPFRVLSCSD